jgi:hypothetical protein
MAFDDEGNGYANLLDAPGGTLGLTGFNMTVHIKRPGKPWTGPITVHNNRSNALTASALLDDKNWVAVDNQTDVNGGPNKPRDGKVGTMYICWSFDSSTVVPAQQIVLMRSRDGGHTWFGSAPGDTTPKQLSQKGAVSGIGCQEAIGPHGEVYVTWYDNQLDALMQVKSTDRGNTFTPAKPIATIAGIQNQFTGQQFRNLSIPTSGVDGKGNVYVAVASQDAQGAPVVAGTHLSPKHPLEPPTGEREQNGTSVSPHNSDIVMFKSTDGGTSYTGPVKINQDKTGHDQFQPWMAVTPKGQVNISYFDRRNDPGNLFIDTYLSRSMDGGKTFRDTRVTHRLWDPRVNPPTSVSGEFIGDYQGLVADDKVAIPFWNDTQLAIPGSRPFSPWQQVFAARIPVACLDRRAPRTSLRRRRVSARRGGIFASGRSKDKGCKGSGGAASVKGRVRVVYVSVARLRGKRCQFLRAGGSLGATQSCSRRVLLRARGKKRWVFHVKGRLPKGTYRVIATAVDASGNRERPRKRRNTVTVRVR